MKKSLLLAALALPLIASAVGPTHVPTPTNPAAPLPEGVTVMPMQGFVDTSGPAYPAGVTNIGISYQGKVIMVNPDCTTPAELYLNDFDTPLATTTACSVDALTKNIAGVVFKGGTFNKNGAYKIVIPDGMFIYVSGTDASGNDTGTELCPGMTLYYDIYVGYSVFPNPGVVEQLSEVVLFFKDADEIIMNTMNLDFYRDNESGSFDIYPEICDYMENDGKKNEVVFRFDNGGIATTFIDPGVYGISISAGAFTYRIYGPNHDNDPEDYVEYKTDEILLKYDIPYIPTPEIYPFTDTPIEKFEFFDLSMPDNFTKWLNNDKTQSYLYAVNDNGIVDTSYKYVCAKIADIEKDCTETQISLSLFDPVTYEPLESYTPPTAGRYCLRIGQNLFSGYFTSLVEGAEEMFVTSSPYDYFYTVTKGSSDVKDIDEFKDDNVTIYTITGMRIAADADPAVFGTLAPGLYIVNGKKVLKK